MIIRALYVFLLILAFSACKKPVIREPEFTGTRNIRLSKLGLASSVLQLEIGFFNPNRISLTMQGFDLDVYLNDDYVGKATDMQAVSIPKLDTFFVPVRVELGMKSLLHQGISLGLSREADLHLKGTATLGKLGLGGLSWQVPVDYRTKYRLK